MPCIPSMLSEGRSYSLLTMIFILVLNGFMTLTMSETFDNSAVEIIFGKDSNNCRIENCLQCETGMPFTCKTCQKDKTCCSPYCKTCSIDKPTTCLQCEQNFAFNQTSKLCVIQNGCDQQLCFQCNEEKNECDVCFVKSVMNPFAKTCMSCYPACFGCDYVFNCLTCDSNYYLAENQCHLCDSNCLQCEHQPKRCIACHPLTYLANYTCVNCIKNCEDCNGPDQCTKCYRTFYFEEKTKKCELCGQFCVDCKSISECNECDSGYYLDETTKLCHTCDQIIPHCRLCYPETPFIYLQKFLPAENFYVNLTFAKAKCMRCQQGFLLTDQNICMSCIPNCKYCVDLQTCKLCEVGYFLNQNYQCQKCSIANCYICKNNKECTCCAIGYFWNNITHPEYPMCEKCRVGCTTCGINYCLTCEKGYVFTNNTCLACNLQCSNCVKRSDNCLGCSVGYYSIPSASKCLKCQNECLKCQSKQVCSECAVGYRNKNNTCIKCTTPNCGYCSVDLSLTSINDSQSQKCQQCIIGYFLNENKCALCSEGCQKCIEQPSCLSCKRGYYMEQHTRICESCPAHCISCVSNNSSRKDCDICEARYYMDEDRNCKPCELSNCYACVTSNDCYRCDRGYYVSLDSTSKAFCEKCPQSCVQCIDANQCISCKVNFYWKDDQCLKCDEECQVCNADGTCSDCKIGYRINEATGLCQSCKTSFCASCQADQNLCEQCYPGYTQQNSTQFSTMFTSSSSLCFKCGQNLLVGCKACSSSNKCTQCIESYEINDDNLCQPQKHQAWLFILIICILSAIVLAIIGLKLKRKFAGKSIPQILKTKKKSADPQDYQKLQQLSLK